MARFERIRAAWRVLTLSKNDRARMYAGARASRLTGGFTSSSTSADQELGQSITALRGRSRTLLRDSAYAKRARELVVNNVIGTGIGMQAQVRSTREAMRTSINDDIEAQWKHWSRKENCHTGGRLSFAQFERALMSQIVAAGEVFVRKHYRKFGDSRVPFALELIEAERLADEYVSQTLIAPGGGAVRLGVEVDEFYRPIAYHIRERHPSEFGYGVGANGANRVLRIPADQMQHLARTDRWPQTRGEPWLHASARKFNDMNGYSDAEITRARVEACTPGAIETPNALNTLGTEQPDGSVEMEIEPGIFKRLLPGEKWITPGRSSPNPALPDFMRAMLRETGAGVPGVTYESLSLDYSQSNYSSSKLGQFDQRDAWRDLQQWFICEFREPIHREWLQQAVIGNAVASIPLEQYYTDPTKFESAAFKPRRWQLTDPAKEIPAYADAVVKGAMTLDQFIGLMGFELSLEEFLDAREHELDLMKERGLVFETSPEFYLKANDPAPAAAPMQQSPTEADDGADQPDDGDETPPPKRAGFRIIPTR